jgi:transposase-like protein
VDDHSGIVNTDSEMYPEVFTMNQNDRSRSVRTGVHDESESVFTVGQNTHWQARSLDALYPFVYLDCIHVKVRDSDIVRVKAVYLALGINLDGAKELWDFVSAKVARGAGTGP